MSCGPPEKHRGKSPNFENTVRRFPPDPEGRYVHVESAAHRFDARVELVLLYRGRADAAAKKSAGLLKDLAHALPPVAPAPRTPLQESAAGGGRDRCVTKKLREFRSLQ